MFCCGRVKVEPRDQIPIRDEELADFFFGVSKNGPKPATCLFRVAGVFVGARFHGQFLKNATASETAIPSGGGWIFFHLLNKA